MTDNIEQIDEAGVATVAARRKRGQLLRRIQSKLKLGRKRQANKLADKSHLNTRARRVAIKILKRKFAGQMGAKYAELSPTQKIQVDKKLVGKEVIIGRIAQRILPKVRQKEALRYRNHKQGLKEKADYFGVKHNWKGEPNAGAGYEGTDELVNKYKFQTPGQNVPLETVTKSHSAKLKEFVEALNEGNNYVVTLKAASKENALKFANKIDSLPGISIDNVSEKNISFSSKKELKSELNDIGLALAVEFSFKRSS